MGMYTELIFGANLKTETPQYVIDVLRYLLGETDKEPENLPFKNRGRNLFSSCSYYFGVCKPVNRFFYDDISRSYVLSTRSSIKDYDNEIESFLEWIKPYIDSGSGKRDFYAIVTYEEDEKPTIYYLNEE